MHQRRNNSPRGFALLLVMIIAVGCVIIAVGLTQIQGKGKEAAIASEDGDRARMLAETGMQRAFAYAKERKKTELDFDLVLDPNLDANCTGLLLSPFNMSTIGPAPKAGPTTFMPTWSDAGSGVAQFPAGKNWRMIPDNGGAYLVRFEDNSDDYQQNLRWVAAQNNNLGTLCTEGTLTLQMTDNPARDRDNGIWVIAMGIYPGTDPNTAKHRHVVRRLLSEASTVAGTAFHVRNNVGSGIQLLNTKGSIEVGNDIQAGVTACGSTKAGNNNNAVTSGAACGTNTFVGSANQSIATPTTPPQPLDPRNAEFYDWESPCNFYSDRAVGFFFWDPTAQAGACGAYTGDLVSPTNAPAAPGGCWVPIILKDGANAVFYQPYVTGLMATAGGNEAGPSPAGQPAAPACVGWEPLGSTPVPNGIVDTAGTAAVAGGASWYNVANTTRSKPDWALCGGPTYPNSEVRWGLTPPDPNATGPFETCTGANPADPLDDECNGALPIMAWCANGAVNNLRFTLADNPSRQAVPTGVYHITGDFDHTGSSMNCAPTDATNPIGAFTWPMFTLIVGNTYDQPNNQDTCWGVGTRKANYASVVVGNDFRDGLGSSSINIAGALFVRNNVRIDKNLTIFGAVRVDNDMRENAASANLRWLYTRDFINTQAAAQQAPGTRLEFTSGL